MRFLLIVTTLLTIGAMQTKAQNESNFEVLTPTKQGEVIFDGPCTFVDLEEVPAFDLAKNTKGYKAEKTTVAALKKENNAFHLKVFLGTWCEDSHRLIPQLHKVLNEIDFPLENLQLYALDREKKSKSGAEQPFAIQFVPTIVVLKNDKEVGRIVENVQKSLETDLLKIVEAK